MAALKQNNHTIFETMVAEFLFSVILSTPKQEGEKDYVGFIKGAEGSDKRIFQEDL